MSFNSLDFILFLAVVFFLYWTFFRSLRIQNAILFLAGYFFYGAWDYRFLALLTFSTFLDYFCGLKINQSENSSVRKTWLIISVVSNLSVLGFFKYYNFFIDSLGLSSHWTLQIILPIGISFYTFHGLSYVFDIYNKKIEPTRNYIDYSVFVCFFPLLVAGPIERAKHLLPQIQNPRTFNYPIAIDGLRQMLWGFFKKIVIADNAARYVNMVFDGVDNYTASSQIVALVLFSVQIYCDFSGYSDIALGTAKIFGFELIKNFNYPFFSRNIAEFWQRWHISLTTWFRDYLYYPLGGNRHGLMITIRNTFIIFLLSAFWHGANWTYIIWGSLHAIAFLPLIIIGRNGDEMPTPQLRDIFRILSTFGLVTILWIFFRPATIGESFHFMRRLFSSTLIAMPMMPSLALILIIIAFVVIEWLGRTREYPLANVDQIKWPFVRWAAYYSLIIAIVLMSVNDQQFIYFQF